MQATIKNFLRMESAGGIVLMAASVLAMIAANTGASGLYGYFIETPVEVRVGDLVERLGPRGVATVDVRVAEHHVASSSMRTIPLVPSTSSRSPSLTMTSSVSGCLTSSATVRPSTRSASDTMI